MFYLVKGILIIYEGDENNFLLVTTLLNQDCQVNRASCFLVFTENKLPITHVRFASFEYACDYPDKCFQFM